MSKEKNSKKDSEESKEEESKKTAESETEDEEESEEQDEQESPESEDEEEEESEHIEKTERDIDSEIEEEEKQGVDEDEDEETEDEEGDDDDKPVTRKELRRLEKSTLESTALTLANSLTETEKEARLVLAAWKNRRYPKGLPLQKQIEEAFLVKFGRNILGQNAEAKRALKNRGRVNNNAASAHREAPVNHAEPKMDPGERQALKSAGFEWNTKTKRFEKKVRGGVVIRNPKTKKAELLRN